MPRLNPDQTKRLMDRYLQQMERAKSAVVKVGLPSDKVGGKVYDDGSTIMEVGASHEYGTDHMPVRSFLRMPFDLKRREINAFIRQQFNAVLEDERSADDALEMIGIHASNISRAAFRTNGYGQWHPLSPATQEAKQEAGKTTPLVWTGLLRGAITWSVK